MNLTIEQIRSWNPCYDPARYLPEGWAGTAKGILRHRDIPAAHKFWIVLRRDVLPEGVLRLFAVDCARRALSRIKNPDPRSINACDVAEKFANGKATEDELRSAIADAHTAVYTTDPHVCITAVRAANTAAYATDAYAASASAAYTADDADADERKEQVKQLLRIIEENL